VRELGYDVLEARDGNSALYAGDVIVHHGRLDPGVQLITNPLAFEDLATRLRRVLDGQDSSRHVY
jgi:hypothetical protein